MTSFPLILPPRLNGLPVDYMPATDGTVHVAFWSDDRRDDGIMVLCRDWEHVRRLIADVEGRVRA